MQRSTHDLHKCEFYKDKVEYLGFDVSARGVQPSPDKVRAVVEWPKPSSVKDVCILPGAGRLLQTVHQELQFEGQAPNGINSRRRDLAVGGATGDSVQNAQEEFSDGTGIAYAKF